MTRFPGNPVFCALDTGSVEHARQLAADLAPHVGGVKLGLEFFTAGGPAAVAAVANAGLPLFLDLKFHDIPNTVAGAVRSALALKPRLLTVHGAGGPAMMRAAVEAAGGVSDTGNTGDSGPGIIAVTVLTSLDLDDLTATGVNDGPAPQALRLAKLAQECGLAGAVCSPWEIAELRHALGPDFLLVVPGIRPVGAAAGDQKRVMGPAEAMALGADILVIGRPITGAGDPVAAARAIGEELGRA